MVVPAQQGEVRVEVLPPSAQWVRWWAWHIRGGRRQPGKVQWRSRSTRAVQIAGVTRRSESADVEDLARAAVDGGDELGVAGQPA